MADSNGSKGGRLLRISNSLLVLAVAIALISVFVLSRANTRLRNERLRLANRLQTVSGTIAGPPSAQVGDLLPSFDSKDFRSSIHYDGKSRYLFFIFSPDCEVCISEFATWKEVARHIDLKAFRVISLATFSDRQATAVKVVGTVENAEMPNLAVQRAYRVVAVPAVMLAAADGKVEWVHYGRLSQDKLNELLATIDGKNR